MEYKLHSNLAPSLAYDLSEYMTHALSLQPCVVNSNTFFSSFTCLSVAKVVKLMIVATSMRSFTHYSSCCLLSSLLSVAHGWVGHATHSKLLNW